MDPKSVRIASGERPGQIVISTSRPTRLDP
jgi:hypothetical protein